jgi:hypothetical protein
MITHPTALAGMFTTKTMCVLRATAPQARQDGTLDKQVVSLQARKELFKALDLIPPEYTFEAASAAVQAAPCSMPGGPTPKPSAGKHHHVKAGGKKRGVENREKPSKSSTKSSAGTSLPDATATAFESGCTAAGWNVGGCLQAVEAEAPRTRGRAPINSYRDSSSDSEPEDASGAEPRSEGSFPLLPNASAAPKEKRELPAEFNRTLTQQRLKHSRWCGAAVFICRDNPLSSRSHLHDKHCHMSLNHVGFY